MATYVERTTPVEEHNHFYSSSSSGLLFGLIVIVLLLWALFSYGIPILSSAVRQPQINVPDKVDVNINQPQSK